MARSVDVLVVCRANHTRSPYIAAELRRRTSGLLTVESAGTAALKPGRGADPRLIASLGDGGLEPDALAGHRPRQLTERMVASATLVITASREVRGVIDSMAPGTTDHVYTLLELAKLLSEDPPTTYADITAVVTRAAALRSRELLADAETDLDDPRGEAREAYRTMIRTVDAALDVIVPRLLGDHDSGNGARS